MKNIIVYDKKNAWFEPDDYKQMDLLTGNEWEMIDMADIAGHNPYVQSLDKKILVVVFDRVDQNVQVLFQNFKRYTPGEEYDLVIWYMFGTFPLVSPVVKNPQRYSFILVNGFMQNSCLPLDHQISLLFFLVNKGYDIFLKSEHNEIQPPAIDLEELGIELEVENE